MPSLPVETFGCFESGIFSSPSVYRDPYGIPLGEKLPVRLQYAGGRLG
jgi:hypothetical protein